MIKKVGFVGLGIMGSRMARTLAQHGFEVTVWNRTREKAEALASGSGRIAVASSLPELAADVDVVCTCVADPRALREVTLGEGGFFQALKPGQLVIDFSTVSAELSKELGAIAASVQAEYVEAPVTGSKNGAETGTLVLMVGCSDAAFSRAQPVFQAVGSKAIHCGKLGDGSHVKLAGNALIAMMLEGFSESLLMVTKAGVDPRKFIEVVQASGYRSPYFDFKGKQLLERSFETHFAIELMFKDLRLFLDSAAQLRIPAPGVAAVKEVYALARAAGKGEQDIAAVVTALEDVAGVRIGEGG